MAALNAVQPYDWAGFLNQRAPFHGRRTRRSAAIERSGWKLVYDGVRSDFWKAARRTARWSTSPTRSGMRVKEDGTIADVRYGGPAQKAGIAPSAKLIAVNGRQFTPTVLREAVAKTATDAKPDRAAGQERRVLRDAPSRVSGRREDIRTWSAATGEDLLATEIIEAKTK